MTTIGVQENLEAKLKSTHIRNNRPTDYLITNRRRDESNRNKMEERSQYYAQTGLQSQFEASSIVTIKRNQIFRRVEALHGEHASNLKEKRERLKLLLEQDEEGYRQELLANEETRESRVEIMKARRQELKDKRENERKIIVEEKLTQRWRNECDELRGIESKVLEQEVADARAEQIAELEEKKRFAAEEQRYFDYLWEQDRLKKVQKEEADRQHRKEMDAAAFNILGEQIEALRKQEEEELRLKHEEAKLLRQEYETRKLEEERDRLRKFNEQRQLQLELDNFNKLKIQKRLQEIQNAIDLDLKVCDEFFRLDESEKEAKSRRKEELKKEMSLYREHLLAQKKAQEEREQEVNLYYKQEEEKLWRARAEKWQKEQKARDRLMQDVLACRREQLQNAVELNRQKQEQTRLDKERVEHQLEVALRHEAIEKEKKMKLMKEYQSSLKVQMGVVEDKKKFEKWKEDMEAQANKETESRYRDFLKLETERAMTTPRNRSFLSKAVPT